jgi:cytochrome c oxidase assembly protein Cox11
MPVIYYVDPAMLQDADARTTPVITLSYTFMEAAVRGNEGALPVLLATGPHSRDRLNKR